MTSGGKALNVRVTEEWAAFSKGPRLLFFSTPELVMCTIQNEQELSLSTPKLPPIPDTTSLSFYFSF